MSTLLNGVSFQGFVKNIERITPYKLYLIKKINDKILFSNYLAMTLLNLKGGDLSWFMRYYRRLSAQLLWV